MNTRTPSAEPVESRVRISQAAFRLFGKKGYACTSVQEIADAAEVKKSIVYYYFSSKEGLYQSLVSESAVQLRRFLEQAVAGVVRPSEARGCEAQLCAIAEMILGLARDNLESVRFFLTHIFAPDADRPPCPVEPGELPRHLLQQVADAAMQSGELCGEPAELVRLVLGAMQYSIICHLRNPTEEPLAVGLGQRIVSAALRGFPRGKAGRPGAASPSHADADPA